MSRNHLRAWKSPYQADGRPVWCVAATHDIGFERDQRNDGETHKIDPAIDGERAHLTPSTPLIEAKTSTGGSYHSDGRILVLALKTRIPTSRPCHQPQDLQAPWAPARVGVKPART